MSLEQLTEGDDFDQILNVLNDNSDDALSVFKIVEQAPIDQQVLRERVLNAITATTTSTAVSVGDKKSITVAVITTGATSGNGATLEVLGSPTMDGDDFGNVGFVDANGSLDTSVLIDTNETNFFELVNVKNIPRIQVKLTVTDGTHTAYVLGGAL